MNCKNCGKVLKDTDKFCWACGTTVEIESVPQQEQPQVQQPQVQQAQAWTQPEPQQTQQPQAQQIPVWQPQQQSQQAPVWQNQQAPVWQNQQAPVWQEAQPQQPVWSQPAPKAPAKAPRKARGAKKKWLPVALIGGAVVAVVAVVLTLFLTGFFDSDEVKVMKAFGKTADAYGQISENLKMPDLTYIEEDQAYSAEMALWADYIEDMEEMNGLGARVGVDFDLPGEKLGMSLTPYYGSIDLVTANIKLDGSKAYVGSPELTDDTYYMVNTKTLGADLAPLIPDAEGLEDLGFNVFELVKILEEYMTIDEAKLKEANENLIKAIEAEKVGSEEMEINGNDIDCDHYEVVIPQDAMEDYVKAIIELMGEMNYGEMVEDILLAMGCPEEVMEDLRYDLEDMNAGEAFEEVEEVLDEVLDMIGDIELDVYLDGGYIMAVVYEIEIEGTEVELILNLGGGDNYVDDLSLRVVADGGEIILASSGNHSGKDGKFTDKTTLKVDASGMKMTLMTSEMSFKSGKGDNFQWTLDMDEIASTVVEVNGSITFGEKSAEYSFDEITISQYGDELATIGVEYKIGPFKDNIKVSDTVEILKLSEDEMMEEVQKLGENVQDWAMGLENKIPELIEAFM